MAQINPIKYSKELQKQIFPDNSFYKHSVSETGVAITTTSVERPVQGKTGRARKGIPKTLPLPVKKAMDSSDSYPTDLVYVDPIVVDTPDDFALNYNKRKTKQEQQAAEIETQCANIALVEWSPSNDKQILKTTGADRETSVIGCTGTRKAPTKKDMTNVKKQLMLMNVDKVGGEMYGLVTADFYEDLLLIPEFTDYDKTGNNSKLEKGVLGKICGINIMSRSTDEGDTGLMYDNSATPKKKGIEDSIAADDLPANLFWNEKMVCTAEGKLQTIVNEKAPGYQGGTVLEAQVRFGAATCRQDQKGVLVLLEAK